MKLQNMGHVHGVPSEMLQLEASSQYSPVYSSYFHNEPLFTKLRARITETIKRKSRIAVKEIRLEQAEMIFDQHFSVKEEEKLLEASQCHLSTTARPILGRVFISTHKVAFCSENSIKVSTKDGECKRIYYKVVVPVGKLSRANESQNMKTILKVHTDNNGG